VGVWVGRCGGERVVAVTTACMESAEREREREGGREREGEGEREREGERGREREREGESTPDGVT